LNLYQQTALFGGLYTLSGVLHGRFDDVQNHSSGEPFMRLDRTIFEYLYNNLEGK